MKKAPFSLAKTSFALVAGGLAVMALSSNIASASVLHTKHNFSATNTGGAHGGGTPMSSNSTTDTTEICVFCHTPHGADQTAYAPIWNRAQTTASFIRFSSLNRWSFDAKEAPIGSVSIACLSCHDGTQAVSAMINTPGSDTNARNSNATGKGNMNMNQFDKMSELQPADGPMNTRNGGLSLGDMIYIGTDLSNDHPISMQYGGGGLDSVTPLNPTNDPDFAQPTPTAAYAEGHPGGIANNAPGNAGTGMSNGTNVNGSGTGVVNHDTLGKGAFPDRWWVDTGTIGYQGTDMPLYTRQDPALGANPQPTVECGTCHDPHSGNTTFLRLPGNNDSQVCLTCHAK